MRDLILQLLPQDGVLGVPGVLKYENPTKLSYYRPVNGGTPLAPLGDPGVPGHSSEHLESDVPSRVFPHKSNVFNIGTPRTLGTQKLVNFICNIEEQHQKGTELETYRDCNVIWLNNYRRKDHV